MTGENLRNVFPFAPAGVAVLVAGGIGITPMIPMIAAAEAAAVEWTLVHGGRTRTAVAFADQLLRDTRARADRRRGQRRSSRRLRCLDLTWQRARRSR